MDIFEAAAVGNTSKLWHILEECPNDVDERNGLWQTPLIVACINNQYLAARLLIERGADILAQDRESGWTPLHHCMYRGYLAVGSLIVKARRDAWRRYSAPTTPKICQQHHPQGYNRRRGSSSTSNQRNHNKRLKRGMVAKSRHGFEYVLKSPLEIEDYEGKRPYDLVPCPCIHGGLFKILLSSQNKRKHIEGEQKKRQLYSTTTTTTTTYSRHHRQYSSSYYDDFHECTSSSSGAQFDHLSTAGAERSSKEYVNLVYSFGVGNNYQLGYSTQHTHQVKPQKISHLDDENVESIATDLNGTFAVTSKGDCFSWGLGHGGRLGLNTYDDNDNSSHKKRYLGGGGQKQIEGSGTYQILPRKMLGFGNNKRLKMIGTHGELGGALTSSGSLYLWGTLHLPIHENTTTTAAAVTNINSKDNGSIIFNKGVSGFSSSSSCSIDGTPKKLHTYEKKINKFVFGSVPFKISSSVKFTSVSVCKSRVCLVAAQLSRVYILGRDIGEQKRAFNSPMHLKEFSNVKDAVASQGFILILTHSGEVLQQDQDQHIYSKIMFPKCMGFQKQASVQLQSSRTNRVGGTNLSSSSSSSSSPGIAAVASSSSRGAATTFCTLNVHITSVCADPGGSHALAVSNLGNVFAWSSSAAHQPDFPVPSLACVGRRGNNGYSRSHSVNKSSLHPRSSPKESPLSSPVNKSIRNTPTKYVCSTSNNSSYGCVVNNDSPVTHGKAGKAKLVKSKRRHNKNRTVATLVPGLSRVFVVQAAIASKHAAIVSKDGDLYTWGKGCIGHGKQTKTLIPTRVHRLRQIAKVAVADGHTVAVQRLKVPLKLTHAKSALIYDDPFAMSRNRIFNNNDDDDYKEYSRRPSGGVVPLLQHLCEEALVESIGIISPTTLFKCFKMAFRLKLDRLVRFCARYIMLNHRHLVPLALKSLSKDELQQIDFFTFLWSTDPYMNLGETKRISMLSAKFPSYLHAEWLHQHLQQEERVLELTQTFYYDHLNSSGVGSSQYNNNNNNNNTCVNNTTTMTTGGGGGGGEGTTPRKSPVHGPSFGSELIELVTAKDGKKHARVLRRVKKRFRELRKKLKQIQSLKKKGIEDSGYNLTIEQRAKVDREKDYADEFDGLKKALRMHQAGRDFLDKMKQHKTTTKPSPPPPPPPAAVRVGGVKGGRDCSTPVSSPTPHPRSGEVAGSSPGSLNSSPETLLLSPDDTPPPNTTTTPTTHQTMMIMDHKFNRNNNNNKKSVLSAFERIQQQQLEQYKEESTTTTTTTSSSSTSSSSAGGGAAGVAKISLTHYSHDSYSSISRKLFHHSENSSSSSSSSGNKMMTTKTTTTTTTTTTAARSSTATTSNPWKSQLSRKARRSSPHHTAAVGATAEVSQTPDSSISSSPNDVTTTSIRNDSEMMPELCLPGQLQLADFMLLPKSSKKVFNNNNTSATKSWSLFGLTSSSTRKTTSPPKSLTEIQREQSAAFVSPKLKSSPTTTPPPFTTKKSQTKSMLVSNLSLSGRNSSVGSRCGASMDVYAPPPTLSLSDAFVVKKTTTKRGVKKTNNWDKFSSSKNENMNSSKFQWQTRNNLAHEKKSTFSRSLLSHAEEKPLPLPKRGSASSSSSKSKSKSFMQIMQEQAENHSANLVQSFVGGSAASANAMMVGSSSSSSSSSSYAHHYQAATMRSSTSAWARKRGIIMEKPPLLHEVQKLEAIQSKQLADELNRQEIEWKKQQVKDKKRRQNHCRRPNRKKKQEEKRIEGHRSKIGGGEKREVSNGRYHRGSNNRRSHTNNRTGRGGGRGERVGRKRWKMRNKNKASTTQNSAAAAAAAAAAATSDADLGKTAT